MYVITAPLLRGPEDRCKRTWSTLHARPSPWPLTPSRPPGGTPLHSCNTSLRKNRGKYKHSLTEIECVKGSMFLLKCTMSKVFSARSLQQVAFTYENLQSQDVNSDLSQYVWGGGIQDFKLVLRKLLDLRILQDFSGGNMLQTTL